MNAQLVKCPFGQQESCVMVPCKSSYWSYHDRIQEGTGKKSIKQEGSDEESRAAKVLAAV